MEDYKKHLISELCNAYKDTHKHVTQLELSQLIGISKSTLDKAYRGNVVPATETLYLIAIFFNITLNDFFKRFDKKDSMVLSDTTPEYHRKEESDGWKEAYNTQLELNKLQKEYTDLAIEHERTKKGFVTVTDAKAG